MNPPPALASSVVLGELTAARTTRREAMLGWMEVAPYGIFTTDTELRIRSWNRWLYSHSGLAEADVIGRSLLELFPEIAARGVQVHFDHALHGEIAVLSTALHKYLLPLPPATRDFDIPHMLQTVRIAPLPGDGEIVGTIAFLEDVTQRECQALILRRQQDYDRLLSSALAVLLESENPLEAVSDLFPRIAGPLKLEAYFNFLITPGTREMRLHAAGGISPEVRKALALASIDGPGPCSRCAHFKEPLIIPRVQENAESHTELIRKIGLRVYAGFPLLIGDRLLGTLSFASYSRDEIAPDEIGFLSTLSKYLAIAIDRALREHALLEARTSLAQHAEVLETKIAERTVKLHETIHQLESFSYTIAHDLRAPIRSLKGYSEILLTDHASHLDPEAQHILGRIKRASHRLDALTRDLLKFSKIGREEVSLTPVNLDELVEELVVLTPNLQNIVTVRGPLGLVRAQRTLLQQCFSNLFDNALKFASPGVEPRIVVRAETHSSTDISLPAASNPPFNSPRSDLPTDLEPKTETAAPRVRIWVEDNGIGIPDGAHEKIFGIFERVSGLDHIEGTGIGLAIVARAMQQMGGTCGVKSSLGRGARFWLDLAAA